jgi:hypothetical protein
MDEYCDNCDFYGIEDTCQECIKHRHNRTVTVTDYEYDGDIYYNQQDGRFGESY